MGAIYPFYQPYGLNPFLAPVPVSFPGTSGGQVRVRYRLADSPTTVQEVVTLDALDLDLTREFSETIAAGSTRFTLGNSVYIETAGLLYRDPSPSTGAGTPAGTLDRTTGRARITSWVAGGENAVTVSSLTTVVGDAPLGSAMWRTPVSPVSPGTLQVRYTETDGTTKNKTVDATGVYVDADCTIIIEHQTGVVRARFGQWRLFSGLSAGELLEDWANPDYKVSISGSDYVWEPKLILADSLVYNAVAQTTLPPDRDVIGIDASRLPPDGKGLIYQKGRMVLVHHTDPIPEATLSPTQVIDCGRVRLYRVVIEDVDGLRLPASFYTVNRELGLVTMAADLDLTGYTAPFVLYHTVADLANTTSVDISGLMTLNKPLSHTYPTDDTYPSYVSGLLYVGNMQSRYVNLFAQSAWTNVWDDDLIGSAPLAQYNDTLYPIIVSNLGAYQDRIVIKFTSSTAFQAYGEGLGYLGTGDITTNFAPANALTGQPYFTMDYRGWGAGWATNNAVRFNLIGANYPIDLLRATQPSNPTELDDAVEILFIGNTDAP